MRIGATELSQHPAWAVWSPGGLRHRQARRRDGLRPRTTFLSWHRFWWWFHMVFIFGFLAYIPYSAKLFHMISAPINAFFSDLKPKGVLEPIPDFEQAESFGASKLQDFTWKQLLDLDACTAVAAARPMPGLQQRQALIAEAGYLGPAQLYHALAATPVAGTGGNGARAATWWVG